MHIYICGIGGSGLGPLANLACDFGIKVSGSDVSESLAIKDLEGRNVQISFNQDGEFIRKIQAEDPIDWFIFTSAINPQIHPEYQFIKEWNEKNPERQIRISKRSQFLNFLIKKNNLQLICVVGTHGKTTTTAMLVWLFQQFQIPVSYLVGTNLPFSKSAKYEKSSQYFVYECDEFDRNFLDFESDYTVLTSLDYDHQDTYLSQKDYFNAFNTFLSKTKVWLLGWQKDLQKLNIFENAYIFDELAQADHLDKINLNGLHNRQNAYLAIQCFAKLGLWTNLGDLRSTISNFPGTQRRFEKLMNFVFTDYAHHPTEIAATIQLAQEFRLKNSLNNSKIVVVYQPHQNMRQYQIKQDYKNCFDGVDYLFWTDTYLTRENPNLEVLSKTELVSHVDQVDKQVSTVDLDQELSFKLQEFVKNGDIIIFMGAGTIDDYARNFVKSFAKV